METYNIGFIIDNAENETQFEAENVEELEELWINFCAENNINTDTITYVESVGV